MCKPEASVRAFARRVRSHGPGYGWLLASFAAGALAFAAPARAGTLLPERGGSPNADEIASLYAIVLAIAGVIFLLVVVALVFALVRYRAVRGRPAAQIRGNARLEIAWTIAATLIIVAIAVLSLSRLHAIEDPAAASAGELAAASAAGTKGEALHIRVIGRQYVWMYRYPGGVYSYGEMVAPVGVTVKLDIVSVDVAHSWWIPRLGGKLDAVPGLVNHTWFRLRRPGIYTGQCAELCGRNHADMRATVRGVSPEAYARWVARQRQLLREANLAAARQRLSKGEGGGR